MILFLTHTTHLYRTYTARMCDVYIIIVEINNKISGNRSNELHYRL